MRVQSIVRSLVAVLLLCTPVLASGQVPTPESVYGFPSGADRRLASYQQIYSFFQKLDAASDRVMVEEIGKTTQGKPMILALISSEENLRNRARYKEISRRLALVQGLSEEEARSFAKQGKAIIWIDGGLHATEVAHAQHTPELAHWLATDEGEEARRIRENAIVLVMPVMNPDGLDIVVNWYNRNLGTPFETAPLPVLYQQYVGHDNNRDWNLFTQAETRVIANQLYHQWFPQIVYNHHQPAPFPSRIWLPPVEDPINPNLDPLVVSSINQIGETMKKRFSVEGKPGAVSQIIFDGWASGYMSDAPNYHNMLGFITETAQSRYATPRCYEAKDIPENFGARAGGLSARHPSTRYPDPWQGGCWRLRDAMDYMMTASRAVADIGARLKDEWLYNIYHIGKRQIARAQKAEGGPFAYVVDMGAQRDPGTAVEMLRALRRGGIEIRRAEQPFRAGGKQYAAGTYVIPPQAFRPFVVDLLDPKQYPDRRQYPGGPPDPPYDVTGYELPLLMGVAVDRVKQPFAISGREMAEIPPPAGGIRGRGSYGYLLSAASNASAPATNRLLARGASVGWARGAFSAEGRSWQPGTLLVRNAERGAVEELARDLGLEFHAIEAAPTVAVQPLRAPRIGLYKSHMASMPEGWTRWVLEQHGFGYKNLSDANIRRGELSEYDVIILPDQGAEQILRGHGAGSMPAEYTGGMGVEGAAALKRFVENGGWLVAVDRAVDFPIAQFGIPVRNTVRGLRQEEFYIPGSLIRLEAKPTDPLAYGLPEDPTAFFVESQVLEVVPGASEGRRRIERDVEVYARYSRKDFLASGWALGAEERLAGRSAAMRVPLGRGQVVLLGFSPHFRAQPHNTFKLLFNPLYASTLPAQAWSRQSAAAR